MAWDFSTEPEFEEQLEWMRAFVREEIWPIEPVVSDLDQAALDRIYAPLQEEVKRRGLWAAHLAARPRRAGLRPGQARPHARDPGLVAVRAQRLRQPGARLGQLRGPRAGRHRRAEGALAAPAAGGRPQVGLLDDRARDRGLGPDRAAHARRARRRRLGPQRPQVVLLERLDRRLPHRHGGHRARRPTPPARLDVHRAGRHPGRDDRPRRGDDGAPGRVLRQARQPRRDPLRGRPPRPRGAAGGGRRRLPHRPAPPRPRAHPSLHALAGRVAARLRHALRARDATAMRRAACWATSRRCRTGSPTRPRRCRRRGS